MIKLLQSSRSVFLLIIVFAIALFFGLNQSGTLLDENKVSEDITETTLIADQQCDPVGKPCMALIDELSMSLQLGSDVGAMKKFNTQVVIHRASDLVVEHVRVEFRMLDMDMGYNNFSMQAMDGKVWKAYAVLPVCVSGRTDWLARVVVTSGSNEYIAEYNFIVK